MLTLKPKQPINKNYMKMKIVRCQKISNNGKNKNMIRGSYPSIIIVIVIYKVILQILDYYNYGHKNIVINYLLHFK